MPMIVKTIITSSRVKPPGRSAVRAFRPRARSNRVNMSPMIAAKGWGRKMPFPAGGTTDVVARLVAQRFSESMKQPVVVDNRGGAGEALAVQRRAGRLLVKRAEGDVPPS